MKITYAITVCNEFIEIQTLIRHLLERKKIQDNIVVLYDEQNGDPEIELFLRTHSTKGEFAWHKAKFNNDFAEWKNHLNSLCNGDYIFQIDADEIPNELLIENLPEILAANSNVDAISVPRWNTVDGLTKEFVEKYNWKVDQYERVNWPDYQWRIYKNNQSIRWINKVHEVLNGFNSYATLPAEESLSLYHPKTIERQQKQNEYYDTI